MVSDCTHRNALLCLRVLLFYSAFRWESLYRKEIFEGVPHCTSQEGGNGFSCLERKDSCCGLTLCSFGHTCPWSFLPISLHPNFIENLLCARSVLNDGKKQRGGGADGQEQGLLWMVETHEKIGGWVEGLGVCVQGNWQGKSHFEGIRMI